MDELTHELMRIPMRLPSKKLIDKSTLDKYMSERKTSKEAIVDPFTRIPFTTTHKPIIDEELKSRIDKFLFDNRSAQLVFKKSPEKSLPPREATKRAATSSGCTAQRSVVAKRLKDNDGNEIRRLRCDLCLNQKEFSTFSSTFVSVPFYRLQSCEHVFCRGCLLLIKNVCSKCKLPFCNAQVTNVQ